MALQQSQERSRDPIDVLGHWRVSSVDVNVGESIGIEPGLSKFRIKQTGSDGYLLEKVGGETIRWNGTDDSIGLNPVSANDAVLRAQNFILKAAITLDGVPHQLAFGTDDSGATLKILVAGNPGGTGTAGRGV